MKCIIGKKLGMTTVYGDGKAENVTVIVCAPNTVAQVRTIVKDGYAAVVVEAQKTSRRMTRMEFRPPFTARGKDEAAAAVEMAGFSAGDHVEAKAFEVGDIVDIIGITKAKGFQGVVKRHGFKGQTTSHGRKHDIRKPGSIGATFPEHVVKGRRMAGRMGGVRFTVRGLRVIEVDPVSGYVSVRGAVPGINGGMVGIRNLGKRVGGE